MRLSGVGEGPDVLLPEDLFFGDGVEEADLDDEFLLFN